MGQIKTNKRNGRKKFRVIHSILIGWPQTSPSLFYMRQMEGYIIYMKVIFFFLPTNRLICTWYCRFWYQ